MLAAGCAMVLLSLPAMAGRALPGTVLWAWERNEDLSEMDPDKFGVAYFAGHLLLGGDSARLAPRLQFLKVPATTRMIPVIRVDVDERDPPVLSENQARMAAELVSKYGRLPAAAMLQIDFDALQSQRQFYKSFLMQLAALLPPQLPLSITALASWCLFDDWMKELPISQAVPMMFSLGRDRQKILLYFKHHSAFMAECCRGSIGLSLEDAEVNQLMLPLVKHNKIPVRIYIFTRTAWTPQKLKAVETMLDK